MPHSTEEVHTIHLGRPGVERQRMPEPLEDLLGFLSPGRDGTYGRLGHYDVLDVLGQGGFGIVVKALDTTLQRLVAIKIMSPRLAATSPPRKYFLREGRSAAKVRHEHVVQIYGVEEEPLPFLVMEYIEGETLQDRLDRTGPLDSREAVRIGREIALGLAAAHATGLIHRDIKPANILLEKGEIPRVKITDFGIARTADDANLTQSGVIIGTPMYMSPEHANGDPVNHLADLFSLGSVLYTMVSGRPPFRASTSLAILHRVAVDTPRPLREVNPTAHEGLCAVISRLHAKVPKDRFESALAVVEALDHCLTKVPDKRPKKAGSLVWGLAAVSAAVLIAVGIALHGGGWSGWSDAPSRSADVVAQPIPEPKPLKVAQGTVSPTTAWENAVASMPVGDQVPAVNARLRMLNPNYDDSGATYTLKDGVVYTLTLRSPHLKNLSPVRALKGLRELNIHPQYANGYPIHNQIKDLSPLRGMKLEALNIFNASVEDLSPLAGMQLHDLTLWGFMGTDLTPLQGMPLRVLNCGLSKVHDLTPLRGMPLTFLCLNLSRVSDLSPLAGMKLTTLLVQHTQVTDLTPVLGMPLEVLWTRGAPIKNLHDVRTRPLKHVTLDFDRARDLELLRAIKTLEKINERPVAEFLAAASK